MPNGGTHHCEFSCYHFDNKSRICKLRHIKIDKPFITTCKNFNRSEEVPIGPLYAMVCEVKGGAGCYTEIPYFDNIRVDTVQHGAKDTKVCFTDKDGKYYEFSTILGYIRFYKESGKEY